MVENRLHWSVMALLAVLLASPALGQTPEPPGGPRPDPPVMKELDRLTEKERGPAEGEEGARRFEEKRRERLMDFLQLDQATRTKLNQRLGQLDQQGEELRRQRLEAVQALREQAKGPRKDPRRGPRNGSRLGSDPAPPAGAPVDAAGLKQALDRVYAVEEAMAGLRRERLQAVRELLTPEQQAKFFFFTMKFRKEMRDRLQREHEGREGGSQERRGRPEGGAEREKP